MELLLIGILLLIVILLLEFFKHFLTRTALKFIVVLIIGIIIFLAIVNSLTSEDMIKTDNEYIVTATVIADNINDQPLIINLKEKIKIEFSQIKEKILKNRD